MRYLALTVVVLTALTGCNSSPSAAPASINEQAALTGSLPYNPLAWRAVTAWTNPRNGTTSTLYGNDLAVDYARTHTGRAYPAGAVLALVTWKEREDPHWFGARIPSAPQSVEFVTVPSGAGKEPVYRRFEGSPMAEVRSADTDTVAQRVDYLLGQRAAVMP
jgi:hypothetical protein